MNGLNGFEKIPVGNFGDLVQVFGIGDSIEKLTKEVAKISKRNKYLTVACVGLTAALYFTNRKTKDLELKVHNLEKVTNFMKEEASDDSK